MKVDMARPVKDSSVFTLLPCVAASLAVAAWGCKARSEIVLVVDTEMDVPVEIDQVQISITGPSQASDPITLDLTAPTTPPFPLTLGLTPVSVLSPVTIGVAGFHAGTLAVAEQVVTGFLDGGSRMLRVVLTAACLGVVCADTETCHLGSCVPQARDGGMLPPWSGNAPARPSGGGGTLIGGRSLWPGVWRVCATKGDTLFCWGQNADGELGTGTMNRDINVRHPVLGLPKQLGSIGLGNHHSCVCDNKGQAFCWGRNDEGELGLNDVLQRSLPEAVPGVTDCLQIVGGGGHTCVLHANARVSCWGRNVEGQTGQSTTTKVFMTPQPVAGISGAVELAAGEAFTCARTTSAIYCWGSNAQGQLGDGTMTSRSAPARVMPAPDSPTQLAAGRFFTCVLLSSGKVSCWGANSSGQLGMAPDPSPAPIVLPGIDDAIALGSGHDHACVLRKGGVVSCWGSGQYGQLGDGLQANSAVPVNVVDIQNATEIAVGDVHTCARHANGVSVSCWGQNTLGQLGDATEVGRARPVQVVGF